MAVEGTYVSIPRDKIGHDHKTDAERVAPKGVCGCRQLGGY